MKSFKFLRADENAEIDDLEPIINLEDNLASWMWDIYMPPNDTRYERVMIQTEGIIDFLRQFSPREIVFIHSIVGMNGFVHTGYNEGTGWGFNIQRDPIRITYLRYIG
jgi:hypothetical protein